MLITAISKPALQGVNLVGHYASLYFSLQRVGSFWGFERGVEAGGNRRRVLYEP